MTFVLPSIGGGIIASPTSAPPAWNGNTYSVDFDGTDDYMVIPQDSSRNITGDLTLSAWINLDSLGAFQGIITKRSSTTNYQFYIRNTNVLSFFDGSNLANDNTALTTGSWIHVAVVVSGSSASFYRDGSFSSTSSGISVSSNTANLTIGDIVGGSFLNGKVDEVSVFDSALSASDITAIYNSGAPADLTSYSPVGWWRMGDNDGGTGTTITDQGSGGNDGTLTNGPTFSTDVPTAPAVLPSITNTYSVDFDGSNDYMSISDADIFSLGNGSGTDNAFSISGWIYPPTGDGSQTFYVATKDASGNREWAFRTVVGELHFFAFGTGGGYIGRKDSTVLSNAQWYHVAMTYDGSKASSGIKLYVDGTRVDDADYASGTYTAAKNTSAEVRVSSLQVNNTYSDGLIDELSIFNTELSASDITAIYNSGVPADISSLSPVGWWRMGDNDSGTGTTITDQGSGGNNGTLTNGPTFSTTVP